MRRLVRTFTPYLLEGDFSFRRSAQLPTRSSTHQNSGVLVQVLIQSKAAPFLSTLRCESTPTTTSTPSTTITSGKGDTHCRFRIFRETTRNCGTFADNKWAWVTAGRIEDPLLKHLRPSFELRIEDWKHRTTAAQENSDLRTTARLSSPRPSRPQYLVLLNTSPLSAGPCRRSRPKSRSALIPACLVWNEYPFSVNPAHWETTQPSWSGGSEKTSSTCKLDELRSLGRIVTPAPDCRVSAGEARGCSWAVSSLSLFHHPTSHRSRLESVHAAVARQPTKRERSSGLYLSVSKFAISTTPTFVLVGPEAVICDPGKTKCRLVQRSSEYHRRR